MMKMKRKRVVLHSASQRSVRIQVHPDRSKRETCRIKLGATSRATRVIVWRKSPIAMGSHCSIRSADDGVPEQHQTAL